MGSQVLSLDYAKERGYEAPVSPRLTPEEELEVHKESTAEPIFEIADFSPILETDLSWVCHHRPKPPGDVFSLQQPSHLHLQSSRELFQRAERRILAPRFQTRQVGPAHPRLLSELLLR